MSLACIDGSSVGKERAITGSVKFTRMQQDQVIKRIDSDKYDIDVLKNSEFHFSDNGEGGFKVELVYKEPRSMTA